jgi:hypothetical protein
VGDQQTAILVGELRGEMRGISRQIGQLRGELRELRAALDALDARMTTHLAEHGALSATQATEITNRHWRLGAAIGLVGAIVPVGLGLAVKRLGLNS